MKRIAIFCVAGLLSLSAYSQTNKTLVKKPVKKAASAPAPKPQEKTTSLTAEAAGRFAKDMARKMHVSVNFEPKKTDYSLSINKWKPFDIPQDDGSMKEMYMVDVTLTWKSAQDGWPTTWKNVEYRGVMTFDEFGCEPSFLIKSKVEPSSSGLAILVVKRSPVAEFDDAHKRGFGQMDSWFEGVQYVWAPGGCLN